MSRLLSIDPCNQRSGKDTRSSEKIPDVSSHDTNQPRPDQPDVTCWDDAFHCPGDALGIRRLDEASVDACFSDLSDLLAEFA